MSLLELYGHIDDFWQVFEAQWHEILLTNGCQRRRQGVMSEMMTIVVHFHQKQYRDFKTHVSIEIPPSTRLVGDHRD